MVMNKMESLKLELYQAKLNGKSQQNKINDLEEILATKKNKLLESQFIFNEIATVPELSPIPGEYAFVSSNTK